MPVRRPSARSRRKRRRRRRFLNFLKILLILLLLAAIIFAALWGFKRIKAALFDEDTKESAVEASIEETTAEIPTTASAEALAEELIREAEMKAVQYDYDAAIELISGAGPDVASTSQAQAALAKYEAAKAACVEQDISQITHIFFHILCVDPENSFNESRWGKQAGGYNSLMTTIPEFEKILQSMYDRGYVLVSLHDMAYEDADGNFVTGKIMLPEGKKAFVMSEDDVCYYEYMKGAGFADKMVIDENGKIKLHYTDASGNESVGDYDLVPILDNFIEEHPDFSYHGHKACLVFTGYNGVLGYRTDETYLPENYQEHKVEGGHDVPAERKEAVEIMKALIADGYDLGSHSWGHRDMGEMSVDYLKTDTDRWERNVGTLIQEATGKPADILIYPKGADIGDWRGYTHSDQGKKGCLEKFNYLYNCGFRYFCNVDSSKYWVQKGDNYLRTGRRALDGFDMWRVLSGEKPELLQDLFNVSEVFDIRRPTPVPNY